ncbi:hypothetical protein AVEN_174007-1 [Araneus ventricosus]|uniref:Uncharacterized protein n=1 Tax=Araneus ventricosus TaxID=182803 RepID=A0A4Y2Q3K8_ARAVE|nr:hypothetical protein AVEN_261367-1 [Araneus ventricosus]GBN58061.1 hypothetical protein AVEN_144740-1 [Araneus ventricosus]GBN58097.1 hypothetical protein AVEN_174007-1 [Araneus ventricosus]
MFKSPFNTFAVASEPGRSFFHRDGERLRPLPVPPIRNGKHAGTACLGGGERAETLSSSERERERETGSSNTLTMANLLRIIKGLQIRLQKDIE